MTNPSAFDVITSGASAITDDLVLSSVFEIEEILVRIQELSGKLEHAKGLKKYRVETAGMEIKSLEGQIAQFRMLIQNTMFTLTDEKTLQYPAIAKVVKRKGKDAWKIADEDAFLQYIKDEHPGELDAVVKTKQVVDTRVAKKLIEDWVESGDVPGVTKVEAADSISITFDSDVPKLSKISTVKSTNKTLPAVKTHPATTIKQDLDALDNLDV